MTTRKSNRKTTGKAPAEGIAENSAAGAEVREQVHMASVFRASDDAIIGKGLDGIITIWSPGAERMYGYTAKEMVGESILRLVPRERHHEIDAIHEHLKRGERIEPFETVRLRKDGTPLDVFLSISPIRDESGGIVGATTIAREISNIVAERRSLAEIQHVADRRAFILETAGSVALDILASRTGVEALERIADAARSLVGAQYAALGAARPDGKGLIEFATVGTTPHEDSLIGKRPEGLGVLGLLLKRKTPLRITNVGDHPASVGFPENHPSMRSFLGVPICRGETVLGSLYLTNKLDGGEFTEDDEAAVQALASYAAVAINNLDMLSRQRALVSGLIAAQEEERRAVAYDLHDGLTQFVMASHAHLEAFRRHYTAGATEKAEREMTFGMKYLKEAVVESRRLVNGLRSLALDDLGLAGAVDQLLSEEKVRAGWDTADLIHNILDRRFDPSLETAVYRVAQEAVTNVRKHASSPRIRVTLLCNEKQPHAHTLTLEVRDWGVGFTPQTATGDYVHFGLHGMSERVHLLGGIYDLQSAPGAGASVRAVFPVI